MARIIIDLLGRKFKVRKKSWEIALNPNRVTPQDWLPCYTKDRYTEQPFGLYYSPDRKDYIMMLYAPHLRVYILYKLRFLGYYEQYDMRYEYKYGKVKLPPQ